MKILSLLISWNKKTTVQLSTIQLLTIQLPKIQLPKLRSRFILLLLSCVCYTTSYANEVKPLKLCALQMLYDISKEQAELAMTNTFNRQLADLGVVLSFKVYPTTETVLNGFDKGECDGMVASPVEILARKNQLDHRIFSVADGADKSGDVYNYEVVINNLNADKLEDLEGKTFAYVINSPFTKTYIDYVLLKSKHKDMNRFFKRITEKKEPQSAIMDVFFGKADAAIIEHFSLETAKELNPQINKKLKVILKSPSFYNTVIGLRNAPNIDFPMLHEAFGKDSQRQLSLEKLDTTFVKKSGRGLAFKLESLDIKELAEMENMINEVNKMKKAIK